MLLDEVKILIVDDVNAIRIQIRDLLRIFGFNKITTTRSGEEALMALTSEPDPFQIVLCDWHMEPTNGLDLLKFVKSRPEFKDLGFIMVTADSTKESVLGAVTAGVDDYLIKPLTANQIQSKVYGALLKKKVLS